MATPGKESVTLATYALGAQRTIPKTCVNEGKTLAPENGETRRDLG